MYVDTPINVRFGETDMMGVVYHANYLLYLEDSRLDFLKALNFDYNKEVEEQGYTSPVHNIEIKYNAPLHYGESGFVRTTIEKNAPMKTIYRQRVYREGDDPAKDSPLVDAKVTLCVVDRTHFKPVNLKSTFPELYAKYNASITD